MTEENPVPPSPITVGNFADETKRMAYARLVAHLNGVSFQILNHYPQAEVQSWTLQKEEAEQFWTAGSNATLDMAPFLSQVCVAQFGEATTAERLVQVREKCEAVINNANNWAALAAYINGIRARKHEELMQAETSDEVLNVMHEAFAEIDQFRLDNNI